MNQPFDPYLPARHIAGSLGFTIYKQFGQCWLVDNFNHSKAVRVDEPDVWHPASYIIEHNADKLKP